MSYAIEKNIPIPAGAARSENDKYGWEKMEVGESIFIPETEVPKGKDLSFLRQRVYQAARKYGGPKGKKFLALVVEESRPNPNYVQPGLGVEDNGESVNIVVNGVRCWRTEDAPVTEPTPPEEK